MKSIVILGLAFTSSALARSTLHVERPSQQLLDDAADNELANHPNPPQNQAYVPYVHYEDYYSRRNDYDDADNELILPPSGWKPSRQNATSGIILNKNTQRERVMMNDDAADNELDNYFPNPPRGQIYLTYEGPGGQNSERYGYDDADNELILPLPGWKPSRQNATNGIILNKSAQRERLMVNDDETDNQLHNYYSMDGNQGNIQFNDYSKTHDDEFVSVASTGSQKLTKDEIDTLASLLKLVTQDQDGNVIANGVKVGKLRKEEAKKTETPKINKKALRH